MPRRRDGRSRSGRDGSPTSYGDDFGFDEGPRGTPTIADGKVLHVRRAGRAALPRAGKTGKQIWAVDTAEKFERPKGFFGMACSPLVEGDAVIVNVGGSNGAGVVAFDGTTGDVRWQATDDEAGYASPVAATVGRQAARLRVHGGGPERCSTRRRRRVVAQFPLASARSAPASTRRRRS